MKVLTNLMQKMSFVIEVIKYFERDVLKKNPVFLVSVGFLLILNTLFPFVNIIVTKYLIDELMGYKRLTLIILYVGVLIFSTLVYSIAQKYLVESQNSMGDELQRYYEMKLNKKIMQIDYSQIENIHFLELCKKAEDGMKLAGSSMGVPNGVQGLTNNISSIFSSVIVILGTITIIGQYAPLLMIIVSINVVFSIYFNGKNSKIEMSFFSKNIAVSRAYEYVCNELSNIKYGKDIRMYDASDMMLKKQRELSAIFVGREEKRGKQLRNYSKKNVLVNSLLEGGMFVYLGLLGIRRIVSIGEFSALIQSAQSFSIALKDIVFNVVNLYKNTTFLNEYKRIMDIKIETNSGQEEIDIKQLHEIEFKNVSFKYSGSENYILRNINFIISANEHLAIVGMNGAGKTTFVKLLCRLYPVTEGDILLNGKSIYKYDFREYITLLSIVFQDVKLFSFSLKENILFNSNIYEPEVINSLCRMGGLEESIKKWDKGLDTIIHKDFEDEGVEPSGGEAQKIALVRALYKDAPIVVLDEPAAALDPISEYELYMRFGQIVKGKTAIYISHRLSSCKFCEKIAVFHEGNIQEYGTHEELMKNENGIYRRMYLSQAQHYI